MTVMGYCKAGVIMYHPNITLNRSVCKNNKKKDEHSSGHQPQEPETFIYPNY